LFDYLFDNALSKPLDMGHIAPNDRTSVNVEFGWKMLFHHHVPGKIEGNLEKPAGIDLN
jgi:hypothetical protein